MRTLQDELDTHGLQAVMDQTFPKGWKLILDRWEAMPDPPHERYKRGLEELRALQTQLGFIEDAA